MATAKVRSKTCVEQAPCSAPILLVSYLRGYMQEEGVSFGPSTHTWEEERAARQLAVQGVIDKARNLLEMYDKAQWRDPEYELEAAL